MGYRSKNDLGLESSKASGSRWIILKDLKMEI
jgi:hypothetical protein